MLEQLFRNVIKARVVIIILGFLGTGIAASFLPTLTRDTSADAFIPADNPARVYREQVKDIFGLADPIVIAVFQAGEHGVFTPEGLQLVDELTYGVQDLPNIDPDRVFSLATENNIVGTLDGMEVTPFFDTYPDSAEVAQKIWRDVQDFPLYMGTLVAEDGTGTLVIAEVLDERNAEEAYDAAAELIAATELPPGVEIHVAGEAAVTGYLGSYIDSDAQRLNPLAGLIITIILFLAFRTLAGAIVPNFIVAATVLGAVGVMAAMGVSFFVITNGMPVVLIGIAVADSIHIFSSYYESLEENPGISNNDAVVSAMLDMARPITLTTLTTIAGFLGLYIASVQPPMQYLGLYTALGVAFAWLYSMTFLPAMMSFLSGKRYAKKAASRSGDVARALMNRLGHFVIGNSRLVVTSGALLVVAGIIGAANIQVDDRRIENFHEDEPIFVADEKINQHFNGTGVFDIVIEGDHPEALFSPHYLKKIEAFQTEIERHEIVGGTTSVVDYLKQMNRSLNENNRDEYRLVDDELLNAQLFLLYSTSGDPTDFEEEIDYDYRQANIRVNLKDNSYVALTPVIAELNHYIENTFNEPGLKATISGRAMVSYEWVDGVGSSHFQSVAVSLVLVFLMAAFVFRSFTAGAFALAPVAVSILFVYAVMAVFDIDIGIGTSMFASVAIGLGVDFAIHTIDRIRILYREGADSAETMLALFPSTGRALFFNLLAIALGFGVLTTSDVVPLVRFGAIVALAVSSAFVFSLTFLPALILTVRPRFVFNGGDKEMAIPVTPVIFLLLSPALMIAADARGEELTGREVMERVVARDDGEHVSRDLKMELIDRRGKTRVRETRGFRKYFGDEKRTVLFYLSPKNIKDTGFLTYDYKDNAVDDDQWLYLPAMRKIRRISASDRGDYFLGTDFSYEDIKNENKPNLDDYVQKRVGTEVVDGVECIVIESVPVSEEIKKELGYSRVLSRVDPSVWIPRYTEFWDIKGNPLKEINVRDIRQVDSIWTSHELHVKNHKTGHQTRFTFSNVDYTSAVESDWFETRRLSRGL